MTLLERVPAPLRKFARVTFVIGIACVAHEALAWLLVSVGVVSRLLSPSPSAASLGALALGALFFTLRLGLVFVAPPVFVASFARAVAALLSSGEAPPAPVPERRRRPRP